jgi:hypothetical protein
MWPPSATNRSAFAVYRYINRTYRVDSPIVRRFLGQDVSSASDPGRDDRSGSESFSDVVDGLRRGVATVCPERKLPRVRSINKIAHGNSEETNRPPSDPGPGEEASRGVPDVACVGDGHRSA